MSFHTDALGVTATLAGAVKDERVIRLLWIWNIWWTFGGCRTGRGAVEKVNLWARAQSG